MASKTFNRQPLRFNVKSVDEKYFDFAKFNGLCDNKNYLGIDQNTFTDVNNLYLDQDNQLSSRPPIKRIDFLNPDEYVIKIYKINSVTIYHTSKNDTTYWIHFKYKDIWNSRQVTEKINIMWFDTRYVIFKEDGIIGFDYDYDTQAIRWYDGEAMIYTPISEIVMNGVRTTHESSNSITTSKFIRYVFDNATNIDSTTSSELIGKSITINIGDEQFTIIWQLNIEKILTTSIGNRKADLIQVSDIGTFIATNSFENKFSYSLDGTLFYDIIIPTDDKFFDMANIIFADDGSSAWLMRIIDATVCKLYMWDFTVITNPSQLSTLIPTIYNVPVPASYDTNLWITKSGTGSQLDMNSTSWNFEYAYGSSSYEFGHSPEGGKFVGLINMRGTYTNYVTKSASFSSSSPSATYSGTENNMFAMIVVSGGTIKTYPILATMSSRITNSDFGSGLHNNFNKVRLVPSNTRPLIVLSCLSTIGTTSDTYLSATCVLNSSYVPYNYFIHASVSNTRRIAREYFLDISFVSNVFKESRFQEKSAVFGSQDLKVIVEGDNITVRNIYASNLKEDTVSTKEITLGNLSTTWPTNYTDTFTYSSSSPSVGDERTSTPINVNNNNKSTQVVGTFIKNFARYKLGNDDSLLTDRYFRYAGTNISLLKRLKGTSINDTIPLYCGNGRILYQDIITNNIYDNNFAGKIEVDLFIKGNINTFVPHHTATFVSNVLSINNKVYIASKREGKVYLPIDDVLSFPNEVTAFANFSQTSLGIFLEDEVHELSWNVDNNLYILSRTKLQLGCRKDSDILLNYDGKTIFMTTIKGLTALNYQDFVQSTEQVYSYLTENIMSTYDKYSEKPLKLAQFKNLIIMYRKDIKYFYLFDLRNNSWWKWTNIDKIEQIIFDGDNLLILINGVTYSYNFSSTIDTEYFDDVGQLIEWTCTSQRLHFNAPNNYKHIKSISIMTSQDNESLLRCKLQLKSYRNLQNLTDTEVVEYELDQLTTAIYKVNFFKLNAFQFTISSDKWEKSKRKFVTPDIAIKYRITERVR